MKVLWVTNVIPQNISSMKGYGGGGWIAGALESLSCHKGLEISIAYPGLGNNGLEKEKHGNISLICFPRKALIKRLPIPRTNLSRQEKLNIKSIIDEVKPDILHVFGTESSHSRIFVEYFGKPERTVIHIQGLVSMIAKHCVTGFPFWAQHLIVPSSLFWGTIHSKKRELKKAGRNEIATIRQVSYVMGRTEWDEACIKALNPDVNYIHGGEILRTSFYDESLKWDLDHCVKHSIYFSQSSKQIKGLHLLLPIISYLKIKFPNIHLYIGGNAPVKISSWYHYLQMSPLGFYLSHLIKKYELENHITFLGPQSEKQVIENLKSAHVFISTSLIENSPNSVGEAMTVGTPVISSDVGGVKDFISHGQNGFLFPVDEPYMIAYYVEKLFNNEKLAKKISETEKTTSASKYSRDDNGESILALYRKMMQ